jgi:cytochrome c
VPSRRRDSGPIRARRDGRGSRFGATLCRLVGTTAYGATFLAPLAATASLAAGDPVRGERMFQYCYSCHSVDPDEKAALQGPNLIGILGKKIAAQDGFEYSPALRAFGERHGTWSEDLLDRYIAEPEKVVPKTTMAFRGVDEPQERADLIAFLKAQTTR